MIKYSGRVKIFSPLNILITKTIDCATGKIDSIPVLEEKILPCPIANAEEPTYITSPARFLTANVLV